MKRSLFVLLTLGILGALAWPAAATHEDAFFFTASTPALPGAQGAPPTRLVASAGYTYNLPSGAEWLDANRIGYRCAFTFLEWEGQKVARVTFSAAIYDVRINDKFMHEGILLFSGAPHPNPGSQDDRPFDCPLPHEEYGPLEPGPLPVVKFSDGPAVLETRDYANVGTSPGHTFRVVSRDTGAACNHTGDRHGGIIGGALECITVVGYQDGEPVLVVYYDRLSNAIQMTSNLAIPPTPVTLGAGTSVLTCPDGSTPEVTQPDPLLVAC